MQQLTKPATQIHVKGAGLIKLVFAGQCVGFATSYRSAGYQADRLDNLFSLFENHGAKLGVDATADPSFGSAASEKSDVSAARQMPDVWVVEAKDGTPIRFFACAKLAEWFRDAVSSYDSMCPAPEDGGEWSDAQIEWFRNHPAPMASACGGSLKVRKWGLH